MNSFTKKIHSKGYRVKDFCKFWSISSRTYERMMADSGRHDKLNKMIEGMK